MYAPIDYDRSLYIFCCNKRVCSLKSDGWTVIRNQQAEKTANNNQNRSDDTETAGNKKGGSSGPLPAAAVTPASTATASVWGSLSILGDDEGEVDMLAMLEARDAALALKKTQPLRAAETPVAKSVIAIKSTVATEIFDVEPPLPPLLPQALRCWRVEAVSDPCPYSTEMLINTARSSGDDDDEDDPFHVAESESALQHVQQMLAGYVAESELEGEGDDQGGDNPVLLELLKSEMIAHKNRLKEKGHSNRHQGFAASSSAKTESTSSNYNSIDNRTEKDDDSMLNKTDTRSRVERAFYATISHAPSQVIMMIFLSPL